MKPEQFIREYGVEKAREVVEGIPKAKSFISGDVKEAQGYNSKLSKYVMWDWLYKFHWQEGDWQIQSYTGSDFTIDVFDLSDLKRLVESLERINKCGGLYGFKTYCNGDYSQEDLQAIRDHESIYGGGDE
ncbi:hypothetical protein LPS07_05495 [Acinetobacter pittii]|uniref:hypothetical protein n=1 Tax=Acinetobacter pittii TaxID=48296 RepID=UPI001E5F5A17|nr:hypothetical protein [Acinetobacter pittii]MDP7845783.1 hypothetical protein [Acinetobacter pittii]MDP7869951.1 hypothetical protein [Acinetobacter pittii]UFN54567.1 hypothetical protein LPS07_05495 [Acinetobacter pittii]HEI9749819.1 hypothetical protein [Acinetobacter baumannii]